MRNAVRGVGLGLLLAHALGQRRNFVVQLNPLWNLAARAVQLGFLRFRVAAQVDGLGLG